MSTPPSKEGGAGGLALRAECEGVISEKVWALLGEERRRMVMDTLHRTEADNVPTRQGRTDEFHFSLVSPGLGFKAMMPSDGYWEAVRRQKEEDARRQKEEDDPVRRGTRRTTPIVLTYCPGMFTTRKVFCFLETIA
ncbi:hypothetical protein ZWY2020_008399 [Hordeum vulgare]|nr:hypothetical protein ZWY2020_008399 [Hordeum vulgare]